MKLLDKYIIRKFLGTFFFAMLMIIVIVIVFDISEKIEDFISRKAPLHAIVFDYFLNFIPFFMNQFSPLFTFIAVIFFTAKLAGNTEIVAILSSGVSFRRLMRPYFIAATVIATLSYFLGNWIIPNANKTRLAFENRYIGSPFQNKARNIHRQIVPGTFVYMESFNTIDNVGYRFAMDKMENGKLVYKLMSDYVRWDTIHKKWQINNYFIRKVNGTKESIRTGNVMDTTYSFTPAEFTLKLDNVKTMNSSELEKFIAEEKVRGSENMDYYYVEKYSRVSFPFATFILTLIGMALSSRKVRGGIGLQLGIGLALSFTYILFMQVANTFATSGGVPPIIAVWIPNIIYGIIGLYILKTAPK